MPVPFPSSRPLVVFILTFAALAAFGPPAQAAPPRIEAPAPLDELLRRHLPLDSPQNEIGREALRRRLDREGRRLLATEGYFDARIELVVDGSGTDDPDGLVLRIRPGPRATIHEARIHIDGPLPEARRRALQEAWSLKPGQPFRQADWTKAKEQLLLPLLENGFPAARITHSEAAVDADSGHVTLTVTVHSGPLHRFGALLIDGLQRYRPELVARYADRIEHDKPYAEDALHDLQNRLENTPYFSSVLVRLNTEAAVPLSGGLSGEIADTTSGAAPTDNAPASIAPAGNGDGELIAPVAVQLRERQPYQLGLGGGISSNTGGRVEASYRNADFFRRAWQLHSGVRLEQLKQTAYADIFLPPAADQSNYAVGVLLEQSDIQNLELQTRAFGLTRNRRQGSIDAGLNLGYIEERQRPQGMSSDRTRALTLNATWTWQPFRGQFERSAGHSSQIQIGGSIRPVSTQNFVRLYGRHQHTLALGRNNTLGLRAEGGLILAPSRRGIPQSFLFRAGGTQSVRGYSYQSLGVESAGGAVLGGRYLGILSAEFTHWIDGGPWGIAAFADGGNAADTRRALRLKTGYGLGARWRSPAGPIGVDLAYGEATGKWHLHFALALPF